MPDALYDGGREALIDNDLMDWEDAASVIKVLLVRGYSELLGNYSVGHVYKADLIAAAGGPGAIVSTSAALTNKTEAGGCLDADDTLFPSVPPGAECQAMIILRDTGNDGTSRLIHYMDGQARATISQTTGASGTPLVLPVDPLTHPMAAGAILTKYGPGTGPATLTVTNAASAGARTLSLASLSGTVNVNTTYAYPYLIGGNISGLPVTPDGNNINVQWNGPPLFIVKV